MNRYNNRNRNRRIRILLLLEHWSSWSHPICILYLMHKDKESIADNDGSHDSVIKDIA